LSEYKNREIVKQLERMLEQAKRGELDGIAFAAHYKCKSHYIGSFGIYQDDPIVAAGAIGMLWEQVVTSMSSQTEDDLYK
jgi:hypothetical protein